VAESPHFRLRALDWTRVFVVSICHFQYSHSLIFFDFLDFVASVLILIMSSGSVNVLIMSAMQALG